MATSDATVRDFLLPDLGEGLTEGEIATWLVDVGTVVDVDDPVAEVETAKAVVEIPSPFAGVVVTRHAQEGEEVQVGQPLISIDTDPKAGTTGAPDPAEARPGGQGEARPTGQGEAGPAVQGEPGSPPDEAEEADLVPAPTAAEAPAPAEGDGDDGASGNVLVGYGTGREGPRRRRRGAATTGAGSGGRPARGPHGRPLAKPPVRRMAKDLGVDLRAVEPSGPGGIITRDDVQAAAEAVETAGADTAGGSRVGAAHDELVERIPVRGVRRMIAEKMTVSRREIPEATSWVDADATALMAMREDLNALQDEVRVSPLALVLRACVAGLARFPRLNARLDDDGTHILVHRGVHLGVATQTDRGLLVPVIADAHTKSTLEIAADLVRLASAARDGTLGPAELTGSTFTVSNYGSFGVDGGAPVINHPEAAILGVGRIAPRPWVVDAPEPGGAGSGGDVPGPVGGRIAVRQVLQLSVAFDHRICDGGEAGGFLRFVADCVERPALLLASL